MIKIQTAVIVAAPIDQVLSYQSSVQLEPGQLVEVPLGTRRVMGLVCDNPPESHAEPLARKFQLKTLHQWFPHHPGFSYRHLLFIKQLARYYLAPLGWALKLSLPLSAKHLQEEKQRILVRTNTHSQFHHLFRKGTKSYALAHALCDQPERPAVEWKRDGYSYQIQQTVIKRGQARWEDRTLRMWEPPLLKHDFKQLKLNPEQDKAHNDLINALKKNQFQTIVLDGVTGSGKTEVYLEAIAHCLAQNKQALVMMPEIGLTSAWLDRCVDRFGSLPVLWHSQLSEKQRRQNWLSILHSHAKLVVGARSSLFLPFKQLGLIIVDEEHDTSYKNQGGLPYQARDMAILKAKIESCVCCLVSATPSLETTHNIMTGQYQLTTLRQRYSGIPLPKMDLVSHLEVPQPFTDRDDKQAEPKFQISKRGLTQSMISAISKTLDQKQQVLLYLNRRGYVPLMICRACGHRLLCPHCDQALVTHRHHQRLICHTCGYERTLVHICPYCHKNNQLQEFGLGVEKLHDTVQDLWPHARTQLVTSDHLSGMEAYRTLIQDVMEKKIDILIGTQMLAKGYHFPFLQMVGIVEGDGYASVDFRLDERHFQLLQQVSGRAGRENQRGHVVIQCFDLQNDLLQSLVKQDRDGFVMQNLENRHSFLWPPFSRLFAITLSGAGQETVRSCAYALLDAAPQVPGFNILGPAPTTVPRIRNQWRYRLIVVAKRFHDEKGPSATVSRQQYWHLWNKQYQVPKNITTRLDIDPYHFD